MKKIMSLVAALCMVSQAFAADIVSIDSIAIMQKSKEGQEVATKIQKEIELFQDNIKNMQKEIVDMQASIDKKAKVLSKEALLEKNEELSQKKKNAERVVADKEEALRVTIQKKQISLREKQLVVANEISEKNGWGMLVDKNTPGVLFVSNAIDKTDLVLKAVNEKYDAELTNKDAFGKKTLTASNDIAADVKDAEKATVKAA